MSLIAEIEDEIKESMRARDQLRTDTLRLTLTALRAAEKELGRPLKEDEELQVLQRERLEEEELERIVDDAIAETGATSLRDLGRVMADVMPQVAGRADGSEVSQLVREKLA